MKFSVIVPVYNVAPYLPARDRLIRFSPFPFCPVMFGVLDRSGKRIGEAFVKGRGDEWLFRLPLAIYGLRRVVDGRRAWAIWFKSVEEVRHLRLMTRSHRLVASLAKWRNRWLVLLACRIALKIRHWQQRRPGESG